MSEKPFCFSGKIFLYAPRESPKSRLARKDKKKHADKVMSNFTGDPLVEKLLNAFGSFHGLEGGVILDAPGKDLDNQWVYLFEGGLRVIQEHFIDKRDGDATVILLNVVNPENRDIESRRSIVIHPSDKYDLNVPYRGPGLRVYVPGEGYVEGGKMRKLVERLSQ